jgi:hypothetical protein
MPKNELKYGWTVPSSSTHSKKQTFGVFTIFEKPTSKVDNSWAYPDVRNVAPPALSTWG